jgi:hypothetical protein
MDSNFRFRARGPTVLRLSGRSGLYDSSPEEGGFSRSHARSATGLVLRPDLSPSNSARKVNIDGLTVAGFEQRQEELLERLHKQLREKTYRLSPTMS